jgi:hypothetical protein
MDNPKIDAGGNKWWYQHGHLHRTGGPAVEHADGHKAWFQHGKLHRTDGPAREWPGGNKEWYLHSKRLSFDEWLNKVDLSDEDKVMMKLKYG